MTIVKGIFGILHFLLKLAILPVVLILTIFNFMFSFAGRVICMLTGLLGGFFIIGGIISLVMDPHNITFVWQSILIGMIIGGVPVFLKEFGSAILNSITGFLADI
ncbi:hypothetical protein SAMN05216390_13321 [Lachnospiraceae bacterium KH1T2]|nr:hypothetical protein SAMN05216390_13321 [Lachnospiraceae bacterium KH1T2]